MPELFGGRAESPVWANLSGMSLGEESDRRSPQDDQARYRHAREGVPVIGRKRCPRLIPCCPKTRRHGSARVFSDGSVPHYDFRVLLGCSLFGTGDVA